jgi:DNA-binding MarR family transcriptional regulator
VLRRAGSPYQLSTRELAERARVTAGAISQRVARAERAGLVERTRTGGTRTVTVTLTGQGHDLIEGLVDRVLGREADLVSCFTADQQAALTELLRTFLTELETRLGYTQHTQVGST